MKLLHRVLVGVLAAAVLIPVLSPAAQADTPKVSADEAVYVNLDYYGKANQINIVKGYSLNGNGKLTDYGSYDKVTNMTDEAKPIVTGDSVSWNLPENTGRFYYECTPKSGTVTLPWSFDVSYKLNGVPTDAAKLAGASGLVEIDVKAIPNKNASDYDKNNMLLQIGTAVNMKDNLSVEAPGAQLQSLGDYKAVLFAGLPGEEKTFTIRIGSKSFESIGIVMMMVPGTLDQLKDIKNIKEDKDTVQGSMDAINQSTNEILGTLESMSGGLKQAQSGLSSLDNARSTISSSKGKIYGNADKALAELSSTTTEISALVPHLQEAQKMVQDINTNVNALVGKLNTTSTYLTDLSVSISSVRGDVNDLRDNLDDFSDNSSAREALSTRLKTDIGTVKSDAAQLQSGLSPLSTYSNDLTKKTATLAGTLGVIAQTGALNPSGVSSDPALSGTIASISGQTASTLGSLAYVTGTTAAVTGGVAAMLNQADQFTTTGTDTVNLIDSYSDSLDDGLDTTDKLLKDTNRIGSNTKNILSGAQETIDSITALNGVINQYKDGTISALKNTEKLTVGLTSGLASAQAFLTSLETVMKTSGNSLDDGTRKSLSGLINVLEQSLNGIEETSIIKNANNTIKKMVDDEMNKYENKNNLLNLDAQATPVSFTSSKNAAPQSIQVVLRTDEISIDKNNGSAGDLETTDKDIGVFARMCNVFKKLWNAITSAFS
jgi:predicted  nucleic acid-binding Zn-ribbon protein